MTRTRILAAALLGAAVLACGDNGPGTPGTLVLSVATSQSDDAGILLTVTGPGIDDVSMTASGQVVYWRLTAENEARILVLGNFASGPLVKLSVPDIGRAGDYVGTVVDVTDRNNVVRTDLDGYQLAVTREGR
jgi:hypothetical protein